MKKLMLILLFVLFIFTGCSISTMQKDETKSFNSEKKAIKYGLNEENIKEKEIMGKIKLEKNEKLVLYRFNRIEGVGVGIGTILQKNNKYTWSNQIPKVILKQKKYDISANTIIKSHSDKKYQLFLGVTSKKNFTLKTPNGITVKPTIDLDTNIYYYVNSLQ